jgi:hypothetical protein
MKYAKMPFGACKGTPLEDLLDGYCAVFLDHNENSPFLKDLETKELFYNKAIKHYEGNLKAFKLLKKHDKIIETQEKIQDLLKKLQHLDI